MGAWIETFCGQLISFNNFYYCRWENAKAMLLRRVISFIHLSRSFFFICLNVFFILMADVTDRNRSIDSVRIILTGNDFDQMPEIMRTNVNVVKIIRENDVVSKIKTA